MVVAKSRKKKQVFSTIVVLMLLIYPVLQTYGYGHYNFAFIIMTTLSVFALFRTGLHSYMPKLLNYYFIFWALSHMLMASSSASIIPVGVIRTYLLFNMLFKEFDFAKCLKFYDILAVIFLAFFFFQEFVYATTGFRVLGVSQSLPLALSVEDVNAYYQKMITNERSSSFFSEPAHFVQFLLPLLIIKIFNPLKKFDFIFAAIILLALLLLQSGNALIGLMAIGGCYLIEKILHNFNFKKFILLVILTLFVGIIGGYYINSEMGEKLLERQEQIDIEGNSRSETSGFLRLFRGYFVYDAMSPIEKIIGADDKNRIDAAIGNSGFEWSFRENDYYFNVVQTLLIRTGIIGTVLFVLFLIGALKKTNSCGKAILVVLICLCFISAIHFTPVMALYLLLANSLIKENDENLKVLNTKR